MKLVYVNELGPNFKGNYVYEFIFSDNLNDIWGDEWDSRPASSKPQPPEMEYIKKVGIFSKPNIEFELTQNSDYFSFTDSIDDVISLAWERCSDDELSDKTRLVFGFGDDTSSVEDKLYVRDLILNYDEKEEYKEN